MKPIACAIALALVGSLWACTEKFEPPPKSEQPTKKTPAATPKPTPPPAATEPPAPETKPEPTTPEEIDLARKEALLDGRADDAVKYCGLQGIEKLDDQATLGCVLAACRIKDQDKTSTWGKRLKGALKREAIKVCHANGMSL